MNDMRNDLDQLMKRFEEVCQKVGLRLTHQRYEIFESLAKYKGHPTAENIYNNVRKKLKTISLDTVYRTILTFEKHGLIKKIHIFDNAARFDINITSHHHIVCTNCKKIEDFYWNDFDNLNLPDAATNWSKIDSRHVEIRGLCQNCSTSKAN